ncbi:EF-hand [Mycena sanguinolenta]|nr:EF-hand [Mycena sanguinolenta]
MDSGIISGGPRCHGPSLHDLYSCGLGEPCTQAGGHGVGPQYLVEPPPPGADHESWEWFLAIDANRSGEIDADELQSALMNPDSSPFDMNTVTILITIFDDDKNGTIDFNEFAGIRQFIENWRKIFDLCDTDQSGTIDEKELDNVLLVESGRDISPDLHVLLKRKYGAGVGSPFESFLRAVIYAKYLSEEAAQFDTDRDGSRRKEVMKMAVQLI